MATSDDGPAGRRALTWKLNGALDRPAFTVMRLDDMPIFFCTLPASGVMIPKTFVSYVPPQSITFGTSRSESAIARVYR